MDEKMIQEDVVGLLIARVKENTEIYEELLRPYDLTEEARYAYTFALDLVLGVLQFMNEDILSHLPGHKDIPLDEALSEFALHIKGNGGMGNESS